MSASPPAGRVLRWNGRKRGILRVRAHAHTVSQKRAAARPRGGIDRDHGNGLPGRAPFRDQHVNQRRFAGPRRAGNAEHRALGIFMGVIQQCRDARIGEVPFRLRKRRRHLCLGAKPASVHLGLRIIARSLFRQQALKLVPPAGRPASLCCGYGKDFPRIRRTSRLLYLVQPISCTSTLVLDRLAFTALRVEAGERIPASGIGCGGKLPGTIYTVQYPIKVVPPSEGDVSRQLLLSCHIVNCRNVSTNFIRKRKLTYH